ncbi:Zinc finger protein zfs1 [Neolecta irregularis DAH-3]|uniref:Zinc finger protein zfs1 n=1 Tax=Neolecta irregularis (strain DAH-3) TaxID=1198029 RepID=A0A1U7LUS4_NEOID|nr:Zinc finger protein zfs1 [Neolecta irregularis DAH-3]|eukprot:OLL26426.1 Zinc finger protein zfs1 [Neolecta irregularis DAH-3]
MHGLPLQGCCGQVIKPETSRSIEMSETFSHHTFHHTPSLYNMYSHSSAVSQQQQPSVASSTRRRDFCGSYPPNRLHWNPPSPLNSCAFDQVCPRSASYSPTLTWDHSSSSPPYSESRFNYPYDNLSSKRQFPRYLAHFDTHTTALNTLQPQVVLPPDSSPSSRKQEARRSDDKDGTRKAKLYKTELCRSWEEKGSCRYGIKCQFAHSKAELRDLPRHPKYKTEPCKTFIELGSCYYGSRCCFLHFIPKKTTQVCTTTTIDISNSQTLRSSRSNSINSTVNPVTPSSSPLSQTFSKTTSSVVESPPSRADNRVSSSSFDNFVTKDLWEAIEHVDYQHAENTNTTVINRRFS